MRRIAVLLIAAAVFVAGWTLPTTAEGPTRLAPIADYLHQVVEVSPTPRGSLGALVEQVDAATATPTCDAFAPPLRRAGIAAHERLDRPGLPDAELKLLAQLVTYAGQVEARCGATPR